MVMNVDDAPVVVLSERIGPLTRWEQGIARSVPCTVVCRRLDDHDQIVANAGDARVVIVGSAEPFGERAFAALPRLAMVARRGAGYDNVDLVAAARHGVLVTWVPDASVEEVSDQALALLVSLYRRIHLAHRSVLRGRIGPARAALDATVPLGEATLGVVGAGRIGRRLVAKAGGLFGRVLVADPYVEDADVVPLPELLAAAHAISLHVPLTAGTRGLIGAPQLRQLRDGVVLVNTSRAGVIDEAALARVVRQGRIGGLGLDVTSDEAQWRRLIDDGFDNLVLTGHTAARGARSQERLRRTCAEQVTDYLSGRTPAHVLPHGQDSHE
jgi:D-3-phosphoglycerate dehydrogenase / 2-oxoglutarate reductase